MSPEIYVFVKNSPNMGPQKRSGVFFIWEMWPFERGHKGYPLWRSLRTLFPLQIRTFWNERE